MTDSWVCISRISFILKFRGANSFCELSKTHFQRAPKYFLRSTENHTLCKWQYFIKTLSQPQNSKSKTKPTSEIKHNFLLLWPCHIESYIPLAPTLHLPPKSTIRVLSQHSPLSLLQIHFLLDIS